MADIHFDPDDYQYGTRSTASRIPTILPNELSSIPSMDELSDVLKTWDATHSQSNFDPIPVLTSVYIRYCIRILEDVEYHMINFSFFSTNLVVEKTQSGKRGKHILRVDEGSIFRFTNINDVRLTFDALRLDEKILNDMVDYFLFFIASYFFSVLNLLFVKISLFSIALSYIELESDPLPEMARNALEVLWICSCLPKVQLEFCEMFQFISSRMEGITLVVLLRPLTLIYIWYPNLYFKNCFLNTLYTDRISSFSKYFMNVNSFLV
uniref:NR LBD domain-containing protein n=1 Tax=Heterorhabditis bacteriophora TaxID=37862 RepID=A0A1I7WD02_HETBA